MIFVIVLILGCLSCGSDTAAPDIDPETQIGTLNISMDDFKFTPDRKVDSVCPYCGVGCQLTYNIKDDDIISVSGRPGPANKNRLCENK